ncbi:MAG: LrgB family protein, partial [Rhodospirillales bacterium]|nr:LrgB family protein [Rhodospirillales bacterium]
TLGTYLLAKVAYDRSGGNPLFTPVMLAAALLIALLKLTGTAYETYFDGAQFVHFLLGPATVALAVPLFENLGRVRKALLPMVAALVAGSATAVVSAMVIARLLGASRESVVSLAPKSVTTPIAMAIAEGLGGIPSLTAALVLITGVIGAVLAPPLFAVLKVKDHRATGFALGLCAHGIGTARAFQMHELAGTFSGIAMAVNGLLTAVMVPLVATWLR